MRWALNYPTLAALSSPLVQPILDKAKREGEPRGRNGFSGFFRVRGTLFHTPSSSRRQALAAYELVEEGPDAGLRSVCLRLQSGCALVAATLVVLTPEGDQFSREDPERPENSPASCRFDLLHPLVVFAAPTVPDPAEFIFILESLKFCVQVADLVDALELRRRLQCSRACPGAMPRATTL